MCKDKEQGLCIRDVCTLVLVWYSPAPRLRIHRQACVLDIAQQRQPPALPKSRLLTVVTTQMSLSESWLFLVIIIITIVAATLF